MKILFRILGWTALGMLLLLALLSLMLLAGRDKITGWGLSQVFKTEVEVNDTYISWKSSSRLITVVVNDVTVFGTHPNNRNYFAKIDRGLVLINPEKLWNGLWRQDTNKSVVIEDILLYDCKLHLLIDSTGTRNFRGIFKGNKPRLKKPQRIHIKKLRIKNVSFVYEDQTKLRYYHYWMPETSLEVDIYRDSIKFDGQTGGKSRVMRSAGYAFLEDTPFEVHAHLTLHKANKKLDFRQGTLLSLDSTSITLGGKMFVTPNAYYDLSFEAKEGKIRTLLNLVPHRTRDFLKPFDLKGLMILGGKMKGQDLKGKHPRLDLEFKCRDVSFRNRKTGVSLENLALSGHYSNGIERNINTTELVLDTLTARLGKHYWRAEAAIRDFRNMKLEASAEARVEAADILGLFGIEQYAQLSGSLGVKASCSGSLRALDSLPIWKALQYDAQLNLHQLGYSAQDKAWKLEAIVGEVLLSNEITIVPKISGWFNNAPFQINANAKGLLAHMTNNREIMSADISGQISDLQVASLVTRSEQSFPDTKIRKNKSSQKDRINGLGQLLNISFPERMRIRMDIAMVRPKYKNKVFERLFLKGELRPDGSLSIPKFELLGSTEELLATIILTNPNKKLPTGNVTIQFKSQSLVPMLSEMGIIEMKHNSQEIQMEGRLHLAIQSIKEKPFWTLSFDRGAVRLPKRNVILTDIKARVEINESHFKNFTNSSFIVDSIGGKANEYPFRARLKIHDWNIQQTDLFVNTELGANVLLNYFSIDNIEKPYGRIKIDNQISGPLEKFLNPKELLSLTYTGRLEIQGMGFRLSSTGINCKNITAKIDYNNDEVRIRSVNGQIGNSSFRLTARMRNALDYLYTKTAILKANAWFESDSLDIQELLIATKRENNGARQTKYEFEFPPNLDFSARIKIKKAKFEELVGEDIHLLLHVNGQHARLEETRFSIFGGTVKLDAAISPVFSDSVALDAHIFAHGLDFSKALAAFNNFDQNFLTSDNISGTFDGQMVIHDRIPRKFRYHFENTHLSLNFNISEGELIDFLPIKLLEPALRADRQRVRPFIMTGRNLRFEDRQLHVPYLELKTQIFDVMVRGKHEANGNFSYYLKVLKGKKRIRIGDNKHLLPGVRKYEDSWVAFRLRGSENSLHLDYDHAPLRDRILQIIIPQELKTR